jgi:hypothetical protein
VKEMVDEGTGMGRQEVKTLVRAIGRIKTKHWPGIDNTDQVTINQTRHDRWPGPKHKCCIETMQRMPKHHCTALAVEERKQMSTPLYNKIMATAHINTKIA